MAKASQALSKESGVNSLAAGVHGGKGVHQINCKETNVLKKQKDADRDNQPDWGVAEELSEDMNASLLKE